jgi:hypothetical protein
LVAFVWSVDRLTSPVDSIGRRASGGFRESRKMTWRFLVEERPQNSRRKSLTEVAVMLPITTTWFD